MTNQQILINGSGRQICIMHCEFWNQEKNVQHWDWKDYFYKKDKELLVDILVQN
jgi:hypothetical protein